jgi:hypothetical protein
LRQPAGGSVVPRRAQISVTCATTLINQSTANGQVRLLNPNGLLAKAGKRAKMPWGARKYCV